MIDNSKIDEFIRDNIGLYWDSTEDLAKALREKFGDMYSNEEWYSIASDGINKHYS